MDVRPALPFRAPSTAPRLLGAFTAAGPAPGDVIVERPEGLARGKFAWPAWGIAVVGAAVVLLALVYYLVRSRGGSDKRR